MINTVAALVHVTETIIVLSSFVVIEELNALPVFVEELVLVLLLTSESS